MGLFNPRPSSMEERSDSGKFSVDASTFTGNRIAVVDTNQMFAALYYLLGDTYYDQACMPQQANPDEWPGLSNIICKSVSAEPMGRMNMSTEGIQYSTDWEQGFVTPKAVLTCTYGAREYTKPGDSDDTSPEPIPLASQSLDFSCEILTVPLKITNTGGETKTVMRHIRLPTITYSVTFPRILKPNWLMIHDCLACVNTETLFGGTPETVLFDGPHADRELKLFGDPAWKLSYKFIYNRYGWNNQLNPDTLVWELATAVEGGEKPYQPEDLGRLLFKQAS